MQQINHPPAGLETDLHPALDEHESSVESDRCYFCYDAPCVTACPTGIDIPLFIRQIQTGNRTGAAKTIFDENILGGMCARVCPTETLCEQACVREAAESQPVKIGRLQRFATDSFLGEAVHPYQRASDSGKRVCVVGAGPAGLACAHRLAIYGHQVALLDAGDKPGGLNEYGIAAYKTVDDFAQKEVEFILSVGGISLQKGVHVGSDVSFKELLEQYDAIFLGIGLGDVNQVALEGSNLAGVSNAVEFIANLRQSDDYTGVLPGRRVVVIGGGMTAIDAAVQARMLGAEEVTIAYRRGVESMNASRYEQELAQINGVKIRHNVQPVEFHNDGTGQIDSVELEHTITEAGELRATGEKFVVEADSVLLAIGQSLQEQLLADTAIELKGNRIVVDEGYRTGHPNIWAGGDCISGGEDLTVAAVQDGKLAAESIHLALSAQ
ncbi:dihydropyrimidine dehydrogenase [Chromatiales bacterium (ex Bugula neritina AB1)]|nr:dihydropyrimidine dehydrogenase [Chromatiales bacterium (ex Bugula neritina AB1)]